MENVVLLGFILPAHKTHGTLLKSHSTWLDLQKVQLVKGKWAETVKEQMLFAHLAKKTYIWLILEFSKASLPLE
ncbi:Hypothetical predicted protein [Pelobates cultripes]|uniref:Uncharacterized protein n=1 Tax=Pelobates cultripes TaxID=61616 RepID=A0AAD1WTN9_PELCU|nr:Hypothetical predicted protein [Pelobates cultripes]